MGTKTLAKAKFVVVPLMALTLLASGLGFSVNNASAALSAVGPVSDPVNSGFPDWFADENGMKLQLCLDQSPAGLCILTPQFDPATPGFSPIGQVSGGVTAFPDESFYWIASADLSPANIRLAGANQDIKILWFAALEQAFLSGIVPGGQSIFLRSQVDIGGLVPGATYNFTTPYGPMSVVADAQGGGRTRLEDITVCTVGFPCNFNVILPGTQTNVGAFLQWDGTAPAAPAGFIGDPNILHTVSGGQGGVNTLTVAGTSVGGVGVNSANTNLFSVSGQMFAPTVKVNQQTVFTGTVSTITGTVSDPTSTVDVTAGVNTNIAATVSPDGTWTVTLPTPLANGKFDVTVTTDRLVVGANVSTTTVANAISVNPATTQMFRLFNTKTGANVYAKGEADKAHVLSTFADFEFTDGVPAFLTPVTVEPGLTPMYRLFNKRTGAQLYAVGDADKTHVLTTFTDFEFTDGIPAFFAAQTTQPGLTPVYRLFNTRTGMHLYAKGDADKAHVLSTFTDFEFTDGVPAFFAIVN